MFPQAQPEIARTAPFDVAGAAAGYVRDEYDPTGEVNLQDPAAVAAAIGRILRGLYGRDYDAPLLMRAIADLVDAYRGSYPGLLRCDTLYHDLRHALETGLTTARLIDGHTHSPDTAPAERIGADEALLCVLLGLYHDIGLLRRRHEAHLWGPVLIPVHEERGVEFMQGWLAATRLAPLADKAKLIMPTKLVFRMPADWPDSERLQASLIATADLLSQFADRCYLEKCRDFLFEEFRAFGLAGTADSPYPDRETLLRKTPDFFAATFRDRLENEFGGAYRLMEAHTANGNPWQEAIDRNLSFLGDVLAARAFSRLRRRPQTFV